MRAYFFGNLYLSSIQQGIQSAHVIHEMFTKYPDKSINNTHLLWQWAREHKTMILLNAGYSEEIRSLVEVFGDHRNPYPWANFYEGEDALDGALTCVGIILPEKIYYGAKQIREGWIEQEEILNSGKIMWDVPEKRVYEVTRWEYELMLRLNQYSLAK